jgi:hypothetical protein
MWSKSGRRRCGYYELVNADAAAKGGRGARQLVRSELIFCRGEIPRGYTFEALVRDAAYDGL